MKKHENPACHPVCHQVCHPEFISGSHTVQGQEIPKRVRDDRERSRDDREREVGITGSSG